MVFFPVMRPPTQSGRITQYFGENQEIYTAFGKRIGVPLLFHNGIDYWGNIGDLIFAPYTGIVTKKGYDPVGYGWYIEIEIYDSDGHKWGWILLAHANMEFLPHVGEKVYMGDVIGYVGKTGNCTGPHVHFELTLYDYQRTTYEFGALGRVNPLPFLQRPKTGSVLSSHWQMSVDWDAIIRGKHPVAKIMTGWKDTENVIRILDDDPERILILRDYNQSVDRDSVRNDPVGSGIRHANFWIKELQDIPYEYRHRIFTEGLNEPPIWINGWQDTLNKYEAAKAKQTMLYGSGLRHTGDDLSMGWGGDKQDIRKLMMLWYIISGSMLSRHEYYGAYKDGPANKKWFGWHIGRMAKHNNWPTLVSVTETGLDDFDGQKHIGWKDFYDSPSAYMYDLAVMDQLYRANDTRIVGAAIFTSKPNFDWLNFSADEPLEGLIASYNQKNLPRIISISKTPEGTIMIPVEPYHAETTERLNLRKAPTTASSIITAMPKGQQLLVSGKNNDGSWLYVDTSIDKGWAYAKYVKKSEVTLPANTVLDDILRSIQKIEADTAAIRADVAALQDDVENMGSGDGNGGNGGNGGNDQYAVIPEPEVYEEVEGVKTRKDWDWIDEDFGPGITWEAPQVKKGEYYYHLQRVDITYGKASFNVVVLDENGNKLRRVVAFAWKDAPQRDDGMCATQLTNKWQAKFTDTGSGEVGFVAGHDAWKPADGPGPYTSWVCDGNDDPLTGQDGGSGIKSVALVGNGFDRKPDYVDHHWISHATWVLKKAK